MRRRVSPAFVAVLGLSGFLLLTAVSSARTTKQAEAPRKAQLVDLIEQRQSQVDRLDERVRSLRVKVTAAERLAARRNALDADEARTLSLLAAQAGATALKGRGVEVRLSDSDRSPPSPDEAGAYRIHDNDLQLVVNALFGAGAEAIAINDNRVVVTTPIRAAGDTIVVNFRPLNPPYRVVAIGADKDGFGRSEIAGRFRRWSRLFGLGFSTRSTDDASVPAYTGRVQITAAHPASPEGN